MYRPKDIATGLFGLLGWRQYDGTMQLASDLVASETEQHYQDLHPLLTLDNVMAIAPDFTDDVKFSDWLRNKTKASILKAIRCLLDAKMSESSAKNILESKALFDGTGRMADVIQNESNYVGFEITPIRANGITTKINKIGLQFKGTGLVKMYLMHSSQEGPVQEILFTRTKDGSMEWLTPSENVFLPYTSDNNDAGGSWYLIYNQNELCEGNFAIKKERDWSKSPCLSCNSREVSAWKVWSKYLEVHPFKIAAPEGDVKMWDITNNLYTYENNYGINLQLTIECDVTDIIIQQKHSFQNIIGLQVAIDMLREFAYNPNFKIGRAQQNLNRNELLYELDGDSQGYKKSGLVHEFEIAMKAVKLDTTSMSRICFPCKKKGIKYRTV